MLLEMARSFNDEDICHNLFVHLSTDTGFSMAIVNDAAVNMRVQPSFHLGLFAEERLLGHMVVPFLTC